MLGQVRCFEYIFGTIFMNFQNSSWKILGPLFVVIHQFFVVTSSFFDCLQLHGTYLLLFGGHLCDRCCSYRLILTPLRKM
uniref:Uncharacterized protein n=1 Tax=Arundo donax TaxID=35708 RepID=A0A0A9D8Y3_ARUDO